MIVGFISTCRQSETLQDILFSEATIDIVDGAMDTFVGEVSDGTDKLLLNGSISYGNPLRVPIAGSTGIDRLNVRFVMASRRAYQYLQSAERRLQDGHYSYR
jgi:hypothetical protein